VERYRSYESDSSVQGEYASIFEAEYLNLIARPKYSAILDALPAAKEPGQAHEGYFSVDKKGKLKNTRGDTADDQDTYALIMRDKERLLSFETPLRFIFSHSALREGWDNPNVFQVCTLLDQSSAISARQKIGRGLRLCVNQQGERLYDRQTNILHVVASEHFAEFADNLQKEIEQETGVKFGVLDITSFIDIEVPVDVAVSIGLNIPPEQMPFDEAENNSDGQEPASAIEPENHDTAWNEPALPVFTPSPKPAPTVKLGHEGAQRVIEALQDQGVIDKRRAVHETVSGIVETSELV